MHYPYSENKGADQLRGYREADLRLCFRLGKNPVFSWRGSNITLCEKKKKKKKTVVVFRQGLTHTSLDKNRKCLEDGKQEMKISYF